MIEFIKNLLSGDRPESSSRLIAIFLVMNFAGWEWYAILNAPPTAKGVVPHVIEILAFIALSMGWKQWNERKIAEIPKTPEVPQ